MSGAEERSLVLVGLMGAGKSAVGRLLAAKLGRPFVDADAEIQAAAGRSIAEIFETYGEPAFRDVERRVIARLLAGPPVVLATGGGAFMSPEIRAQIRARGVSVWLRADIDLLVQRTEKSRTVRPLLAGGDRRAILKRLMDERYPVYAEADLVVDTSPEPAETTANKVMQALAARPAEENS